MTPSSSSASYRIVMVVGQYAPIIGGAEIQAQRLAETLTERGHRVAVLTGRWNADWVREEVLNGVLVHRLGTLRGGLGIRGLRRFGRMWFLRGIERELRDLADDIDVIHVHQLLEPAVSAVAAAERIDKPVLAKMSSTGVTGDPEVLRRTAGEQAWLRLCDGLDRLVAVSRLAEEEAASAGFPKNRIVRIPNGVPVSAWRREDYSNDRRIVCVSRCRPEKGVDVLLPAFERLSRRLAGLRLDIVGGGEELPSLQIMASTRGLSHSVTFHGDVTDVQPFLRDASLFVLPSHTEGMSNALLEAMSAGLPCVATGVGGNTELIEHARTGLLCDSGDPEAMAAAMESLLVNESLRTQLGSAACEKVNAAYSIARVAERYEQLYGELVGGRE